MSKQHYVIVDKNELRQEGDLFWCGRRERWLETKRVGKVGRGACVYIRPVDPVPANPWITDRLPTEEDATNRHVWAWSESGGIPTWKLRDYVEEGEPWRPIDTTPPPSEPTIEELVEELLKFIEGVSFQSCTAESLVAQIRAKQESEVSDE